MITKESNRETRFKIYVKVCMFLIENEVLSGHMKIHLLGEKLSQERSMVKSLRFALWY